MGPRSTSAKPAPQASEQGRSNGQSSLSLTFTQALDRLVAIRMPQIYFTQFYVVAVCSMTVWMYQLMTRGKLFRAVLESSTVTEPSMSFNRLYLCCGLFLVHAFRRLYECLVFFKPTKSTMWIGHWILGYLFYLFVPIAIWVEGLGLHFRIPCRMLLTMLLGRLSSINEPIGNASLSAPSPITMLCIPIFTLASGIQHDCHRYLSLLKKYSLPSHPAFMSVVCPHFTAECVLYLALTFMAAPSGMLVNKTMLQVSLFVFVNRAIAANLNREWYIEKFGSEKVGTRRRLIPGVW